MFSMAFLSGETRRPCLASSLQPRIWRTILDVRSPRTSRSLPSGSPPANGERFSIGRVTTRDIADFRNHLRRDHGQAVATINRNLVTIRRFFGWLAEHGHIGANPAKPVKELKRTALAPKGLDRSQVRKLLREIELRNDIRAAAIFSTMLYSGCRVGDLVDMDLHDLVIGERSGSVVFSMGRATSKGPCRWHCLPAKPLLLISKSDHQFNRVGCSSAKGDR